MSKSKKPTRQKTKDNERAERILLSAILKAHGGTSESLILKKLVEVCERIGKLKECAKTSSQSGNWNFDPYMHGLHNGIELALGILEDRDPEYLDAPVVWLSDAAKPKTKKMRLSKAAMKEIERLWPDAMLAIHRACGWVKAEELSDKLSKASNSEVEITVHES